jgi:hypothetical protein
MAGGFEIARKDWNTGDSQKKRANILKLNNLNHYAWVLLELSIMLIY